MPNEELKHEFIAYRIQERIDRNSLKQTTVDSWLDCIYKKEVEYNKDAAEFSYDEAVSLFKSKTYRAVNALQNMATFMRQYTDYALSHGLKNKDGNVYKTISKKVLEECLASETTGELLTKEELVKIQNGMRNAVDRAILECLFIGISGKNLVDLTSLNERQLDLDTGILTLTGGRTVQLDSRQVRMLQDAFDETEMDSYQPGAKSSVVEGRGYLCKTKPNSYQEQTEDRKFRWVLRRMVIWREHFHIDVLTMKSVAMSGIVHELKIGAKNTNCSLREYLRTEEGKSIAERFGYTSEHYIDVVANKVGVYFKE